jgi:hypothetical protein
MSILENLAAGLTEAAGATDATAAIRKNQTDRQATQHEELEATTKQIFDDLKGLQQRKLALNPQSPTYQKDAAAIDDEMKKAQTTFHDLYHPDKNPGALYKLGGFIKQHLMKKPAQVPNSPQQARESLAQRLSELNSAAATPSSRAPEKGSVGLYLKDANGQMVPAEIRDGKAVPIQIPSGMTASGPSQGKVGYKLESGTVNGQPVTLQHGADGSWKTLNGDEVDDAILKAFVHTAKASSSSSHSKFNEEVAVYEKKYGKPIAQWTPEQLSAFNKKMAQDAQTSSTTVGTHIILVPQPDGSIKAEEVQTTSTKTPGAGVPKTPGEAKKAAAAVAPPGPVKSGDTVGGRRTPAQNKTDTEYAEAQGLVKLAEQAQNTPSATADKNLILTMIRSAAGRVNLQEIEMLRGQAGWANKIEAWAKSASTGQLPDDIRNQIVDLVHQKAIAAKTARDAAFGQDSDVDELVKALKGK